VFFSALYSAFRVMLALVVTRARGEAAKDVVDQLGRGLFRRAGSAAEQADPDLLEITLRAPRATLCLSTALARHGLSDAIPARIDVALPRGQRQPRTQAPARWHAFAADTFELGRDELRLTDVRVLPAFAQRAFPHPVSPAR